MSEVLIVLTILFTIGCNFDDDAKTRADAKGQACMNLCSRGVKSFDFGYGGKCECRE